MKKYISPEFEMILFLSADVITSSSSDPAGQADENWDEIIAAIKVNMGGV